MRGGLRDYRRIRAGVEGRQNGETRDDWCRTRGCDCHNGVRKLDACVSEKWKFGKFNQEWFENIVGGVSDRDVNRERDTKVISYAESCYLLKRGKEELTKDQVAHGVVGECCIVRKHASEVSAYNCVKGPDNGIKPNGPLQGSVWSAHA